MSSFYTDGQKPSAQMLERIETLAARPSVAERWMPSRLIIHNYWLYPYQEFHFADGRLVLRGQNGAGKSTVLVTAVTLALDGEKTPNRMDTFGSNSRSIADYLVGTRDAKSDDDGYHEDRTAYIALEFRLGATDRFRTIGLAIRAERRTAAGTPKLSSWYFVVRDGRRVGAGQDVQFSRREGAQEVMLSYGDLQNCLGPANFVTESQRDYQQEVNQELFGFPDDTGFAYLMQVLIALRSPKLNKDLKPEEASAILGEALPPLNPGLLDKVTRLLDDIDATQKAVKETADHLKWVGEIHDSQVSVFRHNAQLRALDLLEAAGHRDAMEQMLGEQDRHATTLTSKMKSLQEEQAALRTEKAELSGSLRIIQNHSAYKGQGELRRAIDEDARAQSDAESAERSVSFAERTRKDEADLLSSTERDWDARRDALRSAVTSLGDAASVARWPDAEGEASTLRVEVDQLASGAGAPRFNAAALRDDGLGRERRLEDVRRALASVSKAASEHVRAKERVEDRTAAFVAADETRRNLSDAVARARSDAAEALRIWSIEAMTVNVPEDRVEEAAWALAQIADADTDPVDALHPVLEFSNEVRRIMAERRAELRAAASRLQTERNQATVDVDVWRANDRLVEPKPRDGQAAFRAALAVEEIPAVPLYAACDLAAGLDERTAVRLEDALAEAGLLDALIVAPEHAKRVAALAAAHASAYGDRWIAPSPIEGVTLESVLVPVRCALNDEVIRGVLRSVGIGKNGALAIDEGGRWRAGPMSGASRDREAEKPEYIGETNRRLAWARRLAELERALRALEERLHDVQAALETLDTDIALIDDEIQALRTHTGFRNLRTSLHRLREAEITVRRAAEDVTEAETAAGVALRALGDRRRELEIVVATIEEARGLHSESSVNELILAIGRALSAVSLVANELERLNSLSASIVSVRSRLAIARERVEEAARHLEERTKAASERAAELRAIRAMLEQAGLDDLLAREAALQLRLTEIPDREIVVAKQIGVTGTALESSEKEIDRIGGDLAIATETLRGAGAALVRALAAYPTLMPEPAPDGPESILGAAQDLLGQRISDAKTRERITEDKNRAETGLNQAFHKHHSELIAYSPAHVTESGGSRVTFHRVQNETGPLTPFGLHAVLKRDHELHLSAVREKEDELFQEFVYGEVADAIRDAIRRAADANAHVNNLVRHRVISDGWKIKLEWKARDDQAGRDREASYAQIVKLMELSPTVLRADQQKEIKEFFRQRVAAIRDAERDGKSDKPFAQALHDVLDYRQWFRYSIWVQERAKPFYELTNAKYGKLSGAEKSLCMFFPLLAAADARYRNARPSAPKILAMDEAFNGVDETNRNATWRFMDDLHFCWLMTSEKLWGVGASLSACTTYQFVKQAGVAAVSMYLWDGVVRVRDGTLPPPEVEVGNLTSLLSEGAPRVLGGGAS